MFWNDYSISWYIGNKICIILLVNIYYVNLPLPLLSHFICPCWIIVSVLFFYLWRNADFFLFHSDKIGTHSSQHHSLHFNLLVTRDHVRPNIFELYKIWYFCVYTEAAVVPQTKDTDILCHHILIQILIPLFTVYLDFGQVTIFKP